MLSAKEIDALGTDTLREYMKIMVEHLDQADGDDTFGTEGWRHAFGLED